MDLVANPQKKLSQNITDFLYAMREASNYGQAVVQAKLPTMYKPNGDIHGSQYVRNAVSSEATHPHFHGYRFSVMANVLEGGLNLVIRPSGDIGVAPNRDPRAAPQQRPPTNYEQVLRILSQLYGATAEEQARTGKEFVESSREFQDLLTHDGRPLSRRAYLALCARAASYLSEGKAAKHCQCNYTRDEHTNVPRLWVKVNRDPQVRATTPAPKPQTKTRRQVCDAPWFILGTTPSKTTIRQQDGSERPMDEDELAYQIEADLEEDALYDAEFHFEGDENE